MAHNVDLGNLEAVVDRLVESGRYMSKNEVLREGVRLLDEQEKRLASLDEALARGIADVEAGRVRPIQDVFLELKERYRRMAQERSK